MKTTTEYREQFEMLVEQAETHIKEKPNAYKRKLKYLALLGYSIIFILLFLLISIVAGTSWAAISSSAFLLLLLKKKLIIVVLGVTWVLFRSLFVKIVEPEGLELKRDEYPELWSELDALQQTLKTPPIHRVVIVPEMNAAIAQTPRFGIIGPYKNTLVLGLELLISLSPDQAKAVLAHEFAHLSGNHSKFSAWIYRVRLTWLRIEQAFEHSSAWGIGLIQKIVQWYTPLFSGYSFVLARDNEYEADAVSGKLTSNHTAASALVALNIYGDLTAEHFWKPLYDKSYHEPQPANDVYTQLDNFILDSTLSEDIVKRYVGNALKVKTDYADTHPALLDRLKALKSPGKIGQLTDNAAQIWLGKNHKKIITHFNEEWTHSNHQRWQEFYQEAEKARKEIQRILEKPEQSIDKSDMWNLAYLTEVYKPEEDALTLYQMYLTLYPDDMDAIHAVGRLLLKKDDAKGIELLEKTLEIDNYRQDAAENIWQYYLRINDKQQAAYWLTMAEDAYDASMKAYAERETFTIRDDLIYPRIESYDDKAISAIIGRSHSHKKIKDIWLVEKDVEFYKDSPVYALAFTTKGFIFDDDGLLEELAELANTNKTVFLVLKQSNKKLYNKIIDCGMKVY